MRVNNESGLISIENVSKHYLEGEVIALKDVTLTLANNEFISIIGRSGCGKSTLLSLIAGLEAPTSGQIFLNGQLLQGASQSVGIVFQRSVLLQWRTVLANVLLPVELLKLDRAKYRDDAYALLELVGLKGFEERYPDQLSGGMQQRAAVARSLIYDPKVLLMDEPFGALDAITKEQMDTELLRIWSVKKKTVVFVTHDISEAVLLSDRVILMTPRPGSIKAMVDVRLPRPRTLATTYDPQFQELRRHLREMMD